MGRALHLVWILLALPAFGQGHSGELHLRIEDPQGAGVRATVELVCEAADFRNTFVTDDSGSLVARRLPLGVYRAQVQQAGFSPASIDIEVRSAIPVHSVIKLSLASVSTSVTVEADRTLLDPRRVNSADEMSLA